MALTPEEVKKIAHLARIQISDEEVSAYQKDLGKILDLVNDMGPAEAEPMAHPFENMTQPLRADEVTETNQRDQLQENAPDTSHGLYLVNQVIE